MSSPSSEPPQRTQTPFRRLSRSLSQGVDRLRPSERNLLLITAIAVGAITGGAAILFVELIHGITLFGADVLPGLAPGWGRLWWIIVPTAGGLLAGPVIARFAQEAKGHGVPEVMQSLALEGGRIRPRVAIAKIIASSICIGTGGSAGREGPIVQVGSTVGSTIGQLLRLSRSRVQNLVACGAAAGVAATFNAPIAGVAFAIEVLAGELGVGVLSNVVISAVTASVVSQAFLGSHSAFEVPSHQVQAPVEMLAYIALGLIAAVVGVLFIRMLYATEDLFDGMKRVPLALRPAIGGLCLGLVAVAYPPLLELAGVAPEWAGGEMTGGLPHVYGSGFETIGAALAGPLPAGLLLALVVLKMIATSCTLGSGNSGGVFAPALFMGAMLGGAYGAILTEVAPGIAPAPGACALAGMAAVFAAAARAPLTAILIAFEMSGDYGVILPLMASTIAATLLAGRLHPESIYSLKLVRRGIRLRLGRDLDVLDRVHVGDVMRPDTYTVNESDLLGGLARTFLETHRHGLMVVDDSGALVGLISLSDLERAREREGWEGRPVSDAMVRSLLTTTPEETMGHALDRMAVRDVGRMPVVDPDDPKRLLGMIRRDDILRAYRLGRLDRHGEEDRREQTKISLVTGHQLVDLRVASGSSVAGKQVRDLELPPDTLLTTRQRADQRQLIHGDDTLEPGDRVLALVPEAERRALERLFGRPGGAP